MAGTAGPPTSPAANASAARRPMASGRPRRAPRLAVVVHQAPEGEVGDRDWPECGRELFARLTEVPDVGLGVVVKEVRAELLVHVLAVLDPLPGRVLELLRGGHVRGGASGDRVVVVGADRRPLGPAVALRVLAVGR